jgi:hypothetical protein
MNPRLAAAYHLVAVVQLPSGLCSLVPIKGRLAAGVGGGTLGDRVGVSKQGVLSSFSCTSSIAPGDNGGSESPGGFEQ